MVSLPTVLGPVLGPVAGGLILDHWHWSWLFWVNVPFCAVGVVLAAVMLPKDGPVTRPKLDVVGVVLVSPGLVGVLYGLSRSSQAGGFGRADVLVPLIGGLVLILAFVGWSLRRKAALINVRLLDHWPLASSSLLLFLSGIALYGAMLLLPLYYQQLRGMSALGAGLMLIPQGLGTFVSRNIAGRLSDTMGARWLAVIGFGVVVVGTLPFAFAGGTTNEVVLLVTLFVRGLGLGAVTIPLMALAFRGLERADIPDASIISRIASQVGGAFGTAVLAVILQHALLGAHSVAAAATAFQVSFWWSVGFAAVAASLSLVLPGRPRQ
ncbi:MFS transporter [Microlunatus endophyticus]